jgi:DNA (cytosine-5)-methyltransferase 1
MPPVDVLAGGFPCQDLSQAGRTGGIFGEQSGLVKEMFRLTESMRPAPKWVLIENVPFMLQLDQGRAMEVLTKTLSELGYTWAYRVVDTRAFGLPQRRQRVILLASKYDDPRTVLFADEAGEPTLEDVHGQTAYGFYWTEGVRGLGWGIDCVPTLKGGSTVGIPSPPAVWLPDGRIVTPGINDAERLQGFPRDWTKAARRTSSRKGARWKLIGNAVSVPVARWVGRRLVRPDRPLLDSGPVDGRWPAAAWGRRGRAYEARGLSVWPVRYKRKRLAEFLDPEPTLLSLRAARGFRNRTSKSSLRFRDEFLKAVDAHIRFMASLEDEDAKSAASA